MFKRTATVSYTNICAKYEEKIEDFKGSHVSKAGQELFDR